MEIKTTLDIYSEHYSICADWKDKLATQQEMIKSREKKWVSYDELLKLIADTKIAIANLKMSDTRGLTYLEEKLRSERRMNFIENWGMAVLGGALASAYAFLKYEAEGYWYIIPFMIIMYLVSRK